MGKMLRAVEGFVVNIEGTEVTVVAGEIVDADHEIVKRTPAEWWEPLKARFAVESTSAAPGEVRPARIRVRKADV